MEKRHFKTFIYNNKKYNSMGLITRQSKGSKLTIEEMDGNLTYLEEMAQGGGLEGSQYVFVAADGTDIENAEALQSAYNKAKTMSPSEDNRITVIAAPGRYKFPVGGFTLDTEYIDLVSLDGNRSVIIDLDTEDPWVFDTSSWIPTDDIYALRIYADNILVKGMKGAKRNSPSFSEWDAPEANIIFCSFDIGDDLPNTIVNNCLAGAMSFGIISDYGVVDTVEKFISSTFINCESSYYSFGTGCIASGTFIDCSIIMDRDESFYQTGFDGTNFGGYGIASGTFINCQSGNSFSDSFGITASGVFINCKSGSGSFGGGFGGSASGAFIDCEATVTGFGRGGGASGLFIRCRSGNNSFSNSGDASGTFIDCIGGNNSFGAQGVGVSGKLYYCRLTEGTFESLTGDGKIVACIDGNDNFIAEQSPS